MPNTTPCKLTSTPLTTSLLAGRCGLYQLRRRSSCSSTISPTRIAARRNEEPRREVRQRRAKCGSLLDVLALLVDVNAQRVRDVVGHRDDHQRRADCRIRRQSKPSAKMGPPCAATRSWNGVDVQRQLTAVSLRLSRSAEACAPITVMNATLAPLDERRRQRDPCLIRRKSVMDLAASYRADLSPERAVDGYRICVLHIRKEDDLLGLTAPIDVGYRRHVFARCSVPAADGVSPGTGEKLLRELPSGGDRNPIARRPRPHGRVVDVEAFPGRRRLRKMPRW